MITAYDSQAIANEGVRMLVNQELERQQRLRQDQEARKLARIRRENAELRARLNLNNDIRRRDYAQRIADTRRQVRRLRAQARRRTPVRDALWGLIGWLVLGGHALDEALFERWTQ